MATPTIDEEEKLCTEIILQLSRLVAREIAKGSVVGLERACELLRAASQLRRMYTTSLAELEGEVRFDLAAPIRPMQLLNPHGNLDQGDLMRQAVSTLEWPAEAQARSHKSQELLNLLDARKNLGGASAAALGNRINQLVFELTKEVPNAEAATVVHP